MRVAGRGSRVAGRGSVDKGEVVGVKEHKSESVKGQAHASSIVSARFPLRMCIQ